MARRSDNIDSERLKQQQLHIEQGRKAVRDYHAEIEASREKTARLRRQRLAKEKADAEATVDKTSRGKPTRKKATTSKKK